MTGARRHDIDALRVFAFALLILYHVGMVYVAEWGFHIKSPHQYESLQWPMVSVNRWRMSLLFLISGIAIGFSTLVERPGRIITRRSLRLLLPLIFGMLFVVSIQAYYEALSNGVIEPGYAAFMQRYLQLKPWPEGGFAGAEYGVTWNHLWYLAYLWVYSMILAALLLLVRWPGLQPLKRSRLHPSRWPIWALMALIIGLPLPWLFYGLYVLEPIYDTNHALFGDWYAHSKYLFMFLFGVSVARSERFWDRVTSARQWTLGLALLGWAVYIGLRILGRTITPEAAAELPDLNWTAISDSAHILYMWCALLAILGYGKVYLNRPYRWLPYANQAVYPWYILHQSLIIPLAFWLIPLALPGWLEAGLVLVGTVAGCVLMYEFIIRRVRWLHPLFGVKLPPQSQAKPTSE
ncbi:MAG: acyltransferase [Pseudomonadota bacterium]